MRNWEFVVGLARGPNAFTLSFDRSETVDRNPPPGPPRLSAHAFPQPPPAAIKRSPDIDSMYQHYLRHLGGGEQLPAMAYFCLTKLEQMAGGRDAAAVRNGAANAHVGGRTWFRRRRTVAR